MINVHSEAKKLHVYIFAVTLSFLLLA